MSWKADMIHGVVFPAPNSALIDAADLWKILFNGQMPETYNRVGGFPAPTSNAEGEFNGNHLQISSTAGRVDLRITSLNNEILEEPPRISNIIEVLEQIIGVQNIIANRATAARVANVLNLAMSFESQELRYGRFKEILPNVRYPQGSSDFIYQYNLRKLYNVQQSMQMNRVLTWTSADLQMVAMQIDMSNPHAQQVPLKTLPNISWKIDINSVTSANITDMVPLLLEEHLNELKKIISKGGILQADQ